MHVSRAPAPALRRHVSRFFGFTEQTPGPKRRREGPGTDIVVVLSFEDDWWMDGERHRSFVGGLRSTQVVSEHAGRSNGIQINLTPAGARALFRVPLSELAERVVAFEDPELVERAAEAPTWEARFDVLDDVFARRLAHGPSLSPEVDWAWERLHAAHGRLPVGTLATDLGWSRKRLADRFREEVGLAPKAAARILRFERARELAQRPNRASWVEIALECGYYDQSHLINEFRAVTGRAPETFLQDAAAEGP